MDTGKKITGGKYHARRKSRLYDKKTQERHAILGETKLKHMKVRSGRIKTIILRSNQVNLLIDGKVEKAQIVNVEETPQNTFLARQNRLIKGAVISTDKGKARITNRPTQEGMVNAVLLK